MPVRKGLFCPKAFPKQGKCILLCSCLGGTHALEMDGAVTKHEMLHSHIASYLTYIIRYF